MEEKEVINFAEWLCKNYWYSKDSKCFYKYGLKNKKFNLIDLLKFFKYDISTENEL